MCSSKTTPMEDYKERIQQSSDHFFSLSRTLPIFCARRTFILVCFCIYVDVHPSRSRGSQLTFSRDNAEAGRTLRFQPEPSPMAPMDQLRCKENEPAFRSKLASPGSVQWLSGCTKIEKSSQIGLISFDVASYWLGKP